MIDEMRFMEMLRRLLDKSKVGKVNWQQEGKDAYCVGFPSGALIRLMVGSPPVEADWAGAYLIIKDEVVIKIVRDDGRDDYGFVYELYQDARRCVLGWDSVVEEIDSELQSDKDIGESPVSDMPF